MDNLNCRVRWVHGCAGESEVGRTPPKTSEMVNSGQCSLFHEQLTSSLGALLCHLRGRGLAVIPASYRSACCRTSPITGLVCHYLSMLDKVLWDRTGGPSRELKF